MVKKKVLLRSINDVLLMFAVCWILLKCFEYMDGRDVFSDLECIKCTVQITLNQHIVFVSQAVFMSQLLLASNVYHSLSGSL